MDTHRWVRIKYRPSRSEPTHAVEEHLTAGIYGLIVSSAVMSAAHVDTVGRLAIAVLVTLGIYWAAERYARVVAALIAEGRRLTPGELRRQLVGGWAIVTTSAIPLGVLTGAGALGADVSSATFAALTTASVLLGLAGWEVGRGGNLALPERLVSALVAATFGVLMIVLKALLH